MCVTILFRNEKKTIQLYVYIKIQFEARYKYMCVYI